LIQKLIQTITPQLLIFHLCLNYFNVFMASQLVAFWMLMTCSLLAKIDIWTSIKNSAKAFFASPLSDLFGTMKFMHISPLALFDVSSAFNLVDHCILLLVLQCFSASFGLTHTIPLGCPSKLFGITDLSYCLTPGMRREDMSLGLNIFGVTPMPLIPLTCLLSGELLQINNAAVVLVSCACLRHEQN